MTILSPSNQNVDEPKQGVETNHKLREVYCDPCKKYYLTTDNNPSCIFCEGVCITVVSSVVTGMKLTGNEPLSLPLFQNLKK